MPTHTPFQVCQLMRENPSIGIEIRKSIRPDNNKKLPGMRAGPFGGAVARVLEDHQLMTERQVKKYSNLTVKGAMLRPFRYCPRGCGKPQTRYPVMIKNPVLRIESYEGAHWNVNEMQGKECFKDHKQVLLKKLIEKLNSNGNDHFKKSYRLKVMIDKNATRRAAPTGEEGTEDALDRRWIIKPQCTNNQTTKILAQICCSGMTRAGAVEWRKRVSTTTRIAQWHLHTLSILYSHACKDGVKIACRWKKDGASDGTSGPESKIVF